MKTFISLMILMIGMTLFQPFKNSVQAENSSGQITMVAVSLDESLVAIAQDEGANQVASEQTYAEKESSGNFLLDNWGAILISLLGFVDLIARLTPSEKDNSIVNFLMSLFNTLIPNLKKGGGSFRLLSK
ncbi:MAG: hypothetical protein WAO52_02480 [Prolixibacteraceae bacterium]